jgi:hypothetical protein
VKRCLITCRADPAEGQWWEIYKLAQLTFREYAGRYGYEYRDFFYEDLDPKQIQTRWPGLIYGRTPEWPFKPGRTSPCWLKIPIIEMMLAVYDEVLYLDNDCVILDMSKDIASEVQPLKWLAMAECTSGEGTGPNVGVAYTRSTPMARKFWRECWTADYWKTARWTDQGQVFGLLGYNHNPPISKLRSSEYDSGYYKLGVEWNDWAEPGVSHSWTRIKHCAWGPPAAGNKLGWMQKALKEHG